MRTFYFKRDSNYDKEYGNKSWLYINNFGYYSSISKDIVTARPIPRQDYHLLYVSHGEVLSNGAMLKSGDSYLLLPGEPHTYTYKKAENSRYYWMHFTGNKAGEVLSLCEISKGVNRSGGRGSEKDSILAMLTEELIGCADEASEYAVSLLFSFLSLFKRGGAKKRLYAEAIRELETSGEGIGISEVARLYNITPAHFIRSFKAEYGVTPNEYRQNYRISKATNLLRMTDLSVQDVAYQCGFSDPLYFSRIFAKRVGVSPSKYRMG